MRTDPARPGRRHALASLGHRRLPIYEAALPARRGREGWYTPLGARRRHTRSWRARRWIGEDVTEIQDARDVLRVCSHYELRKVAAAPFPAWLAVETDVAALERQASDFARLVDETS